jgi:hypothetical protein
MVRFRLARPLNTTLPVDYLAVRYATTCRGTKYQSSADLSVHVGPNPVWINNRKAARRRYVGSVELPYPRNKKTALEKSTGGCNRLAAARLSAAKLCHHWQPQLRAA